MPSVPSGPETPVLSERPNPAAERPEAPDISPVEADEAAREALAETQDDILHAERLPVPEVAAKNAPVTSAAATDATKDEVVVEVEKILEDGLGPFYGSLPEEAKPLFKKRGEEAAREISQMVRTFHIQVKRAMELIIRWLKTIPGVNKFFLEQEAKIKTDRIVALAEERRTKR